MADTSLERFHALTGNGDTEPLLNFKWICIEAPYGLDPGRIESVSLPFPKLAIKEGYFGSGSFTYFPGFEDIDSFDLEIYEDSKASALQWSIEWRNRIRDPDSGFYALPPEYKQTFSFELHDTTGQTVITVNLIDCWPSQPSPWALNYKESGRIVMNVNFSCDDCKVEFHK